MNRNLDRCYFRVQRSNGWENVCFSDLTKEERDKICEGHSAGWFKVLAYHLANCLKNLGDQFDIVCEDLKDD